jgi:hypothetical protein
MWIFFCKRLSPNSYPQKVFENFSENCKISHLVFYSDSIVLKFFESTDSIYHGLSCGFLCLSLDFCESLRADIVLLSRLLHSLIHPWQRDPSLILVAALF